MTEKKRVGRPPKERPLDLAKDAVAWINNENELPNSKDLLDKETYLMGAAMNALVIVSQNRMDHASLKREAKELARAFLK